MPLLFRFTLPLFVSNALQAIYNPVDMVVVGNTIGPAGMSAVSIGGTSFAGGVGGIPESFIGLFALQLINNVMSMLGIGGYVQQLAEGVLIVLIIFLDCYSRELKRERV